MRSLMLNIKAAAINSRFFIRSTKNPGLLTLVNFIVICIHGQA